MSKQEKEKGINWDLAKKGYESREYISKLTESGTAKSKAVAQFAEKYSVTSKTVYGWLNHAKRVDEFIKANNIPEFYYQDAETFAESVKRIKEYENQTAANNVIKVSEAKAMFNHYLPDAMKSVLANAILEGDAKALAEAQRLLPESETEHAMLERAKIAISDDVPALPVINL